MSRRHLPDAVVILGGGALFVLVAVTFVVGTTWLFARAVSDTVCSDYNFISNDFCDEWHYESPSAEDFPLPDQWKIAWDDLSCGSGGCPTHVFVVRSMREINDPVRGYVDKLREDGWTIQRDSRAGFRYFTGRKDGFRVHVESAATEYSFAPRSLRRERFVEVAFSLENEGGVVHE